MPASGDVWVADPADRTGGVTPRMRQYRDLKQRYPDYLLLFRLGDFYELFLAGSANNFLLAVVRAREGTGVALLDVSTGDFWAGEDAGDAENVLAAGLMRRPSEILVPETAREAGHLMARLQATGATLTFWDPAAFALRAIAARQDAVQALLDAPAARAQLRRLLAHVGDLERLTSRATLGVAHARDLVGLRACLQPLPEIRTHLGEATAPLLTTARDEIAPLDALLALLQQALVDEPPLVLHEGGLIREGWSDALSALIEDSRQAREWIAGLEERERSRTGLSSLRVRFNRVFGYGIA